MPADSPETTSPVTPIFHQQLCAAIEARRLVVFDYQGRRRIAEPHDYGVLGGRVTLFFHQVGGESRSGRPVGWRQAHVPDVSGFQVLDRRFRGARPGGTGRHLAWEVLFASVSQDERTRP
jgi:hypothetical protein